MQRRPATLDPRRGASLSFGRHALDIAYRRLRDRDELTDPDPVAVGAAVAECCGWICALLDVKPYGRKSDLLEAIRWARNAALHELVVRVVKATEGLFTLDKSTLDGPDRLPYLAWIDREMLGPPGKRDERGEAAYDMRLAGQPVLLTIGEARCLVDPAFSQ